MPDKRPFGNAGLTVAARLPLPDRNQRRPRVEPGDMLFGDLYGVCVIPRRTEQQVFTAAMEKYRGEKRVAKAIREGTSAVDAFKKFGIM